ncbi:MAG: hypothetical protein KF871_18355 [Hydrogenophaga sp.]|uniref:hypothetical protein n=1 Tax=Hydrogenophaga sp. TaxID=1904254 RepID=UPI001D553A73|nr:hypothetical protein [Hydrogenophaga sp.]MBX3611860.1 hypothetical protein [Hydrogenophaga sp.]
MLKRFLLLMALPVVAALVGCAHPISLTADTAPLMGLGTGQKVDRTAVLVMTEAQLAQEVVSPGGGGDKVSYKPYKDMQSGLYVALNEVFAQTRVATSLNDPRVGNDPATLVVIPTITTTSYSPSLFTWPPTIFTITVELSLTDAGRTTPSAKVRAQGEGRAEFDEFKSDFSLSSKRAAQDVLTKLINALQAQADNVRRWTTTQAEQPAH